MKKQMRLLPIILTVFLLCSCQTPTKDDAKEWLNDCRQALEIVTEYLSAYEYPEIYISDTDSTMSLQLSQIVLIENEEVIDAVDTLFTYGFQNISKNEDDNRIQFSKLARFDHFRAGLVYSLDRKTEPEVQYVTKLERLTDDGWYYYEADYNEWRLQQDQ